ncbi:MAG: 23S rRNA (pseudouridine1915-N3)-methyltransferase RlmH [Roseibaca calidilacus]|uniref:Ribosomal RNA large subunit methyltransferase H n=1 Tax=Roseibaca calidilacus TaxID=1666912 RepID=A0A0P7W6E3_9RHOB|nr:23S rRNA (pseudouridine(1915)-N(3))-methyltransferase RlmH [Roseibaca calidilacus]KPP92453.1 MAG: 23S rRNA (pseudouridine1915-N3)-methyltransferase RlmH [Roseibaca calidilacus]CUX79749.1 23S rRNA (pseudouridine1915-N3)-methyltransferase [Roseibaca calidilacus]
MRLHICAMGRLRKGPERALIDDYRTRFDRIGRALSLGPCDEHEVDERKATTPAAQVPLLARAIPDGAHLVALDERGVMLSSPDFAQLLARTRDHGARDMAFVIGGADGLDPDLRARADTVLSLSPMVWPHMLARVMLAEQIYRAATILSGSPYHRD